MGPGRRDRVPAGARADAGVHVRVDADLGVPRVLATVHDSFGLQLDRIAAPRGLRRGWRSGRGSPRWSCPVAAMSLSLGAAGAWPSAGSSGWSRGRRRAGVPRPRSCAAVLVGASATCGGRTATTSRSARASAARSARRSRRCRPATSNRCSPGQSARRTGRWTESPPSPDRAEHAGRLQDIGNAPRGGRRDGGATTVWPRKREATETTATGGAAPDVTGHDPRLDEHHHRAHAGDDPRPNRHEQRARVACDRGPPRQPPHPRRTRQRTARTRQRARRPRPRPQPHRTRAPRRPGRDDRRRSLPAPCWTTAGARRASEAG